MRMDDTMEITYKEHVVHMKHFQHDSIPEDYEIHAQFDVCYKVWLINIGRGLYPIFGCNKEDKAIVRFKSE